MSLKFEQYESLKKTREFLFDLLDPKKRPKSVKEMRKIVSSCLRHYPPLKPDGEPIFSNDDIKK